MEYKIELSDADINKFRKISKQDTCVEHDIKAGMSEVQANKEHKGSTCYPCLAIETARLIVRAIDAVT